MTSAFTFKPYKRPLIIYGEGARGAEVKEFAEKANVPVLLTWRGLDLLPSKHHLVVGTFGTHAPRWGNFAVQNADFLLVVGSRLDTRTTGTPLSAFAPNAKIVMVDIDSAEIEKFGSRVEGIVEDSKTFLSRPVESGNCADWLGLIRYWQRKYPVSNEGPYKIIKNLSDACIPGDIIVTDTGCALAWVAQVWEWKKGQRLIHAFNQTPMGYGLPAAYASHYASGQRILAICGDGSLMMSLAELATIAGKKVPVKIILLDNKGHSMCRQTQREWFGGKYPSTSVEGGLTFPDFEKMKSAFGVDMEVYQIDPEADVVPKATFGKPIHDQAPYLPREELAAQMDPLYWAMVHEALISD